MAISDSGFEDWISLCETPQHPDLFFLGAADKRITFYSQQVRAFRLVHALSVRNRIAANERVAIIGGGAAGASAAIALASVGAKVVLFEKTHFKIALQHSSQRLLHPNIYDWPKLGALENSANLPFLNWEKGVGGDIAPALESEIQTLLSADPDNLNWLHGCEVTNLQFLNGKWSISYQDGAIEKPVKTFRKVILAVGFGEEQGLGAVSAVKYWPQAGVATPAPEVGIARYFVSGIGDGGLTDMLSVLIKNFKHTDFTEWFLSLFDVPILIEQLAQAETNGGDLMAAYKEFVFPILDDQDAIATLACKLRTDRKLVFNSRNCILERGAASKLNQLMAYALIEACESSGKDVLQFSTGDIVDVRKCPTSGQYIVFGPQIKGHDIEGTFSEVILRHGPSRDLCYAPFEVFYANYRSHHQTLICQNAELGEPPRLSPETYEFLDERYANVFCSGLDKQHRLSAREKRKTTITIDFDLASGAIVQRGLTSIEEIASDIVNLQQSFNIELRAAAFSKIPKTFFSALIRLSKASNGKIKISAPPESTFESYAFDTTIQSIIPFHPTELPAAEVISIAVEKCMLHQIGNRLNGIIATNNCPKLGSIHQTITNQIEGTWRNWRAQLDGDTKLRSVFLQKLARAQPDGLDCWDGDLRGLDELAAALVLALATDIERRLIPSTSLSGNFSIADDAFALASGCSILNNERIDDCKDFSIWSADALIFSSASQLEFNVVDSLVEAGEPSKSLMNATRVAPAIIQNSKHWRDKLKLGILEWRNEVADEFDALRQRQNNILEA